ncbi:hypothetical protein SPB21_25010 [Leptothoe sp. ISB3NOV94-8A]|uniref:hypothetical protein n=1 Tax=Adonisia turfae TaxID=2950184 RepID=UPI0013D3B46F|nr:hypothetical protein [Adonisia turfae]MDV3347797.1 hypothetical protein [Leptothoe sp. LEGE 181152]
MKSPYQGRITDSALEHAGQQEVVNTAAIEIAILQRLDNGGCKLDLTRCFDG